MNKITDIYHQKAPQLHHTLTPYIYILLLTLNIWSSWSQDIKLSIQSKIESNQSILEQIEFETKHHNITDLKKEAVSILEKLNSIGYLNTTLNTIVRENKSYTAYYNLGRKIDTIIIDFGHLSPDLISRDELNSISTRVDSSRIEVPISRLTEVMNYLTELFERKGNSFTTVSLKNIDLAENKAKALIDIQIKSYRTIDKIKVKGYNNFPTNFISKELNLKVGHVFNEKKLENASLALNNLNFVEEIKAPEVLFTKDSTIIYLYLKKKKSNKFDGIIGFASKENSSGLEFNGYLDLSVNNIFNGGETIALYWKNNGNDRQRFYLMTEVPFLFNTPLIPKVNFQLFRQDSTFSNTTIDIGLKYKFMNHGSLTATYNSENSTDLTNGTNEFVQSFSNSFYGLSYKFIKNNEDVLFPEKYKFSFQGLLGSRKSQGIKTNQLKILLLANYQWSINSKNYIFLQNQSGLLDSDNYLDNELFRIGGINNLRGVNEESLFVSQYSIFNLEYRFKPNFSSYFYSISDFSYSENKIYSQKTSIISLGLGYAFSTKAGLINLSYALGKFNNQPFLLEDSKVHVKIISYF